MTNRDKVQLKYKLSVIYIRDRYDSEFELRDTVISYIGYNK